MIDIDFELDDDGYPTDETLDGIANWPHEKGFPELLDLVRGLWYYDTEDPKEVLDLLDKPCSEYRFATGGWSGNESLIGALQRNFIFWAMCWYMSQRGGLHVFRVRNFAKETD